MHNSMKVLKFKQAVKKMQEAAALLREVSSDTSGNWFLTEDAKYNAHHIEELLDCDNHEGGIIPMLERIIAQEKRTGQYY